MNVFQILNIFNHLSGHSIILVCEIIGIILITFTVFWQFEGLHLINSNHCLLAVLLLLPYFDCTSKPCLVNYILYIIIK